MHLLGEITEKYTKIIPVIVCGAGRTRLRDGHKWMTRSWKIELEMCTNNIEMKGCM